MRSSPPRRPRCSAPDRPRLVRAGLPDGAILPRSGQVYSGPMIRSTAVTVNGALRPLAGFPVHTSLLDFLRGQGLTGAKEGCAEGECGACAVLVARPDGARSGWVALNACLVPAAAYDGQEVVTAEGIGGPERLHPVQREMAERGGSQCGYCTPGFVCSMAAEYYRPQRATAGSTDGVHSSTPFDVEALSGNLCRCTGYRPIRDAALALGAPDRGRPPVVAARRTGAPAGGNPGVGPGRPVHPSDGPRRGPDGPRRRPRSDRGGRQHGLGCRGQPPWPPCVVPGRRRPAGGAAGVRAHRRGRHCGCRADPQRARAAARRTGAPARRGVAAVRVAVDPQRRDARWQPRHGITDR